MKIKTLIIDDEPLARQRIKNLISDIPEINLVDECSTGKKAIKDIEKYNPDLILLDIQLKDMTGFQVLERSSPKRKPVVIFITAYNEYALKAFEFFAFDYLQKPFKDERFYKSINNALEDIRLKNGKGYSSKIDELLNFVNNKSQVVNDKKLPIKVGSKFIFINTKDIKYITASGYYVELFHKSDKHLIRESLSNLILELNSNSFSRIHRSTIVNLNYVKEVINSNYGETDVKMNDDTLFRVSRSFKKEFLNRMGI